MLAKTYTLFIRLTLALTNNKAYQLTLFERFTIKYYNCRKLGHIIKDCTKPKQADIKKIKEKNKKSKSENDYA